MSSTRNNSKNKKTSKKKENQNESQACCLSNDSWDDLVQLFSANAFMVLVLFRIVLLFAARGPFQLWLGYNLTGFKILFEVNLKPTWGLVTPFYDCEMRQASRSQEVICMRNDGKFA